MSDLFKAANLPSYLKDKFEEEIWTKEDRYSDHLQELIATIRANVVLDFNNKMQALADADNYKDIIEKMNGKLVHEDECGKLWQCEKIRAADDEASFFYNEKEDQYTLVCQDAEPPLLIVEVVNRTAEPDGTFNVYYLPVHHELRPIPNPLEVQNLVDNAPLKLEIDRLAGEVDRIRETLVAEQTNRTATQYLRAQLGINDFVVNNISESIGDDMLRIEFTRGPRRNFTQGRTWPWGMVRSTDEPSEIKLPEIIPEEERREFLNVSRRQWVQFIRERDMSTLKPPHLQRFPVGYPSPEAHSKRANLEAAMRTLMHRRVDLLEQQEPKTEDELGYGPAQKLTARNAVASTFGLIGEEYRPAIET